MPPGRDETLRLVRSHRVVWGVGGVGLLALACTLAAVGLPTLFDRVSSVFALLQEAPPIFYFGAMAIVCLLPIPISAFYVASGPLYGTTTALAWIAVALAINISISHGIASSWLRPAISRLLEARGVRIPEPRKGSDQLLLILLVRITPGLPFFLQNLLLGFANVDRLRNLIVSLPIQMVFAAGFVLLGRSAFDGSAGLGVTAIGLIGSASIAARFVHKRLQKGAAEATDG